jgi:circadian clock protein KaiC
MLDGRGYYRGASVLVSGTAGVGKSSIAAHFVNVSCARGERSLYFPFEESERQIVRNMSSIGIDLGRWIERGRLRFHAARPHLQGLESHLAMMIKQIADFDPGVVVVDPMTNLLEVGNPREAKAMLLRLVDFLKSRGITALFTSLTSDQQNPETTEVGMSSLMDTWLLLRNLEGNGERNRGIYVLKSRGMPHSNQIRELVLTNDGIQLKEVYTGTSGVLAGTARVAQEASERAEKLAREQNIEHRQRELDSKRQVMEAQIAALQAGYLAEVSELEKAVSDSRLAENVAQETRGMLATLRGAETQATKSVKKSQGENDGDNGRKAGKAKQRQKFKRSKPA